MLKEKSFYKEGLPVNVVTANIEEYPIHFHDDIEVVYVMEGSVRLKNGYYNYTLEKGDIFILNDRELHSFYSTGEPNMVMMLQLESTYFSKYYNNLKNSFFVTDMKDDDESLEALRDILAHIMLEVLEKGRGYEHKVIENAHNLISSLLANFQYFVMEDGKFVNETKYKGNKVLAGRLNRITNYMYENYSRRLTLQEIAESEHLSIYYLSHAIKKATGMSFQELLGFMRVEESEKLLLGTNKKIGAISEECGFSAVRYYIKYFTKWFGMHPKDYREKYTGKVISREIAAKYTLSSPADILASIRQQSKHIYHSYESGEAPTLSIIKLDLHDIPVHGIKAPFQLEKLFENQHLKPGNYPYRMFMALGEIIVATGENYLVTRAYRSAEKAGFTILIYHNNKKVQSMAQEKKTLIEAKEWLERFDDNAEILIRISGIRGEYKIRRYKFTKDYFIRSYMATIGAEHSKLSKREKLMNRWATTPIADLP